MRAVGVFMAIVGIMALTFFPTQTHADTACQQFYGGGQTCTTSAIRVEKDVVNPVTNNDVHDLGQADPNFLPNGTVTFHITIRNTGTNTVNRTTIVDSFPQFLTFATGPGAFATTTDALTFVVGALAPNQAQTFTVTGRIPDAAHLPPNQTSCVVNQVTATTDDQQIAQDSSQFCIQNGTALGAVSTNPTVVNPAVAQPQVIQTPATGANPLLFLGLIATGAAGVALQKFARKEQYGS